jgi:hypothetical protein
MPYAGASALAVAALSTDDPEQRAVLLQEAEALLAGSKFPHNHLTFGMHAIHLALQSQDYDEALRLCAALERVNAAMATLVAEAGRAVVACARGESDADARATAARERLLETGFGLQLARFESLLANLTT